MIRDLTEDAEEGRLYMGIVKKIMDFGAFVEIMPGTDGLVHISELDTKRVKTVTEVLNEGDKVLVKCIGVDKNGKIKLSRKEALGLNPDSAAWSCCRWRRPPAGWASPPDPVTLGLLAALGTGPTAVAYTLYFRGLRTAPAGTAGAAVPARAAHRNRARGADPR